MQYMKTMKGLLFWGETSFSVLGMYRHFKGTYWFFRVLEYSSIRLHCVTS